MRFKIMCYFLSIISFCFLVWLILCSLFSFISFPFHVQSSLCVPVLVICVSLCNLSCLHLYWTFSSVFYLLSFLSPYLVPLFPLCPVCEFWICLRVSHMTVTQKTSNTARKNKPTANRPVSFNIRQKNKNRETVIQKIDVEKRRTALMASRS